jgi:hypothetical protein
MGTVILTQFSLLVPTFSLLFAPRLLPLSLRCSQNARLLLNTNRSLYQIRSFGGWLKPRYIFGAGSLDQ